MKYGGVNRFKRFYKNRHAVLRAEITDIKKKCRPKPTLSCQYKMARFALSRWGGDSPPRYSVASSNSFATSLIAALNLMYWPSPAFEHPDA